MTDLAKRAHEFAVVLISDMRLPSGETALDHARAVATIASHLDHSDELQAACYLTYTVDALNKPQEVLAKQFGASVARLAVETRQLIALQGCSRASHAALANATGAASLPDQTENVRKMLLAFGRDLRVVFLRLASRLQTLRFYAALKTQAPQDLAQETLNVFAPLANRLGLGALKWELEDLSFRFLDPLTYKQIAGMLAEKRTQRDANVQALRQEVHDQLQAQKIHAQVDARPKHIYSIVKKMRGKNLPFERVFDVQAMRVLVDSVSECYAVLAWLHTRFAPIAEEYDDYIAKPKSNGYQSLHTVVRGHDGKPIEIQIRTRAMHEHAEQGVAAHWAYKEAGTKGYGGVQASSDYDRKIAMLRALLDWEREVDTTLLQDRIYVLTPEAQIIDLPQGATPVDFAYQLHTNLGHRCRGATVNGVLVPLNTKLQSGQTIAITAAKEGGPSRDWLNPELGFLVSSRARAKVRAWFNAQVQGETIARGREIVEKLLQREGKTALKHDDLANQLGFSMADALFEAVGKDEFSSKTIEQHLRPGPAPLPIDEYVLLQKVKAHKQKKHTSLSGVLVVGVDSLLTQLAKCCKPAPPDAISGFVTRGKGVSIHRANCSNFLQIAARNSDRVIDVAWNAPAFGHGSGAQPMYPIDIGVQASDRKGLLKDLSEVFSVAKINVIAVQLQTVPAGAGAVAWTTFTVEVADTSKINHVLSELKKVAGVQACQRR